MSATNKSQQIYGSNLTPDVGEALSARTADALWFAARQWQMGEFEAESGGRPMRVFITATDWPITHLDGPDEPTTLDQAVPWEPQIEAEPKTGTPTPSTWQAHSLSYSFTLSAANFSLIASDYDGRHLDWHDFHMLPLGGSGGAQTRDFDMVPGQIQIPGAPEARWWEIEDGTAYFDTDQDPEPNVLSMLLPEFFYLDVKNWYVLPTPAPAGTLRQIERVEVIDSFGIVTEVAPLVEDGAPADADRDWACFALSGGRPEDNPSGATFLAPDVAVAIGQNDLVEEVRVLRDENANLVWGWERQLTDAAGALFLTSDKRARQVDGREQPPDGIEPPSDDDDGLTKFRLMSNVDRAWVPYLPRHTAQTSAIDGSLTLRRGRVHEGFNRDNPQYRGQILSEAVELAEEEVPVTGLTVKRHHRFLRDTEGRLVFWVGRSRDIAPDSPSPGLRFDYLKPKPPAN